MAWILNTTTNDIYTEDTVQGNVHTCFESPFPKILWYVTTDPNDVRRMDTPTPHYPCFDIPFPSPLWYVSTNPNDVRNASYREAEEMGAFYKASELQEIIIPESVKSIGAYSFAETALTEVALADDCTYYSTSFPEDCTVTGGHLIT